MEYQPGTNAERVNRLRASARRVITVMSEFHLVAQELNSAGGAAALVLGDLAGNQDLTQVYTGTPPELTLDLAQAIAKIGAGLTVGEGMYSAMYEVRTELGNRSYFDVINALAGR